MSHLTFLRATGFVSQWGGMEVGSGMLFPVSVVDGLVHQLGGWSLQAELAVRRLVAKQPCPVGTAVYTSAGRGDLANEYNAIVHTTPPFYKHDEEPEAKLRQCYASAFQLAFADAKQEQRVAVPLLGAGARGFPYPIAIEIASKASVDWIRKGNDNGHVQSIAFGLLEDKHAQLLSTAIADETASSTP